MNAHVLVAVVWFVGAVLAVAGVRRWVTDDEDEESLFLEGLGGLFWPVLLPLALVVLGVMGVGLLGRKLSGR